LQDQVVRQIDGRPHMPKHIMPTKPGTKTKTARHDCSQRAVRFCGPLTGAW
jgi:hypothetical protein